MRASPLVVLAAAAAAVSAQAQNYTSELEMKIDPNTVQVQVRASWCQAQTNTCTLLCDNETDKNSCAQEDLSFACTCASNSSAPGLQYYVQTMPTFICETLFEQCNIQQVSNAEGQKACMTNIKNLCGKNPPPKGPVSGDSASTTAATTATASTTSASSTTVSTSKSAGFAAPTLALPGSGAAAAAAAVGVLAYFI